jgi:hypothetical protein
MRGRLLGLRGIMKDGAHVLEASGKFTFHISIIH